MKKFSLLAALMLPLFSATALAACPAKPAQPAQWLAAQSTPESKAGDRARRQTLALELLDCLSSPDPHTRDQFAYTVLSDWMRAGVLQTTTLRQIQATLLPWTKAVDEAGFRAPFAALVLAEVARVDRQKPFLDDQERRTMLEAALTYLREVKDYRGYAEGEGWRHGVAHGADWLMQLALNPALQEEQLHAILQAIAAQITADGKHVWRFGEGARLARPVLFAAARVELQEEAWRQWLKQVLLPLETPQIEEIERLNRLHNAREFLWPLYVAMNETGDEGVKRTLLPAVRESLRKLQ